MNNWLHEGYDLGSSRFYPHASEVNVDSSSPFQLLWSFSDVGVVGDNPVNIRTGDINGDGELEVVVAGHASDRIIALRNNGDLLWIRNVDDDSGIPGIKVSPSGLDLCDVDGDQVPEVFVGLKKGTANTNLESRVLVYDGKGDLIKIIVTPDSDAMRGFMCADLDSDGNVEIVTAISADYPRKPRGIYVYSYATGLELWNYSVGPVPLLDAISDLDGDGDREIVVGTFAPHNGNFDGGTDDSNSYVIALDKDGNKLWQTQIGTFQAHSSVADLDGDGTREIVTFQSQDPTYYQGPNKV
jgi:hypothetical protein